MRLVPTWRLHRPRGEGHYSSGNGHLRWCRVYFAGGTREAVRGGRDESDTLREQNPPLLVLLLLLLFLLCLAAFISEEPEKRENLRPRFIAEIKYRRIIPWTELWRRKGRRGRKGEGAFSTTVRERGRVERNETVEEETVIL